MEEARRGVQYVRAHRSADERLWRLRIERVVNVQPVYECLRTGPGGHCEQTCWTISEARLRDAPWGARGTLLLSEQPERHARAVLR